MGGIASNDNSSERAEKQSNGRGACSLAHLRLRQIGGYKFRRQRPIGPYIVDFVCLEKHVVVEIDGGQHRQRRLYDARRDGWLKGKGFTVLRFWDDEVLKQVENVKQAIWEAICAPSLILPRDGGEEN
jgi:very-short-patch-repair endonuclease